MIVHVVEACDGLEDYEVERLEALGFDEIWYEYNIHFYDGSGALLARKDTKFVLFDLGHCSCYGPLDDIDLITKKWEGLDELWGRLTEGTRKCVGKVFELARKS